MIRDVNSLLILLLPHNTLLIAAVLIRVHAQPNTFALLYIMFKHYDTNIYIIVKNDM